MTVEELNVDPAEVARFSRLADEWWSPTGRLKPLHDLAPARLAFIRQVIDGHLGTSSGRLRPLAGRRVLDVGCGGGLVSEPLARLGGDVVAIDLAAESIGAARAHADSSGLAIDYRVAAAEDLVAAKERFDFVVSLEVIEHVPDAGAFVATLARLVAPGGCLVLSTLNRTMKSYALAIVGAEYVLRWLDRGTHDWNRFVTPGELRAHLEAAGMRVVDEAGTVLNPFEGRWVVSSDMDVNYMMAAKRSED